MPHSDRSLEIIYEYYEAIHDADKIQTQVLGKNQEVRTFGNQVLMSNDSHNAEELRLAEANQFAAMMTGLGLELKDDIDARSRSKERETALHGAVKINRLDLLITLLDHGASPAIEDANGNNVIMLAAELGRKEMLQEFCKMLKVDAKKEASKSEEIKIEAPAAKAQEQKMEAERAKVAEIQGKKKHHPKRVALTDEELKKKNKDGKTAICLLEEVLNSGSAQAKDDPAEREVAKKKKELTAAFKDLVNNLSHHHAALKKSEPVVDFVPIDSGEVLNRYWHSCSMYQNAFVKFENAFLETRNEVKLKNPEEKASNVELNAFVDTVKDKPSHVILPYDRATIAGVLALLNQYSYFTFFHPLRRYRQDATKLVEPYLMASGPGKKEIATVKDVIEFYQRIMTELVDVQKKDQTSEDKNDQYNSGYCRRLTYCKRQLESTAIVQNYLQGDNHFNIKRYEDYLKNNRHKLQVPRPIND